MHECVNKIYGFRSFFQNMNSLRQKIPSLISKTLKPNPKHLSYKSKPPTEADDHDNTVVKRICDSFRLGSNWDNLSKKFHDLDLNEALVEKVLLALKQPTDARRALGFFHWSGKRNKSVEHGLRSYSIAIHILVKARMNIDAKALIESVLKRESSDELSSSSSSSSVVDSLLGSYWVTGSNPFVFDLLVQCYSKLRMSERGFEACRHLEQRGFCLSLSSFNALLARAVVDDFCLAWKIYEHMVRVGAHPNDTTVKTLVGCLCSEGNLKRSVEVLERIGGKRCSSPYVIVNTSLVFRVLEQGRVEEAMSLLKRMLTKNMVFDYVAYSLIVYAKVQLGELDNARETFDEMLMRGFKPNSFVHTLLIGAYCDKGRTEEASLLMEAMASNGTTKPYDDTFSALVKGYARARNLEESLGSFEKMLELGFLPNSPAFNEMVKGLCEDGDIKRADSAMTLAIERGFVPDEIAYSTLILAFGEKGEVDEILKLFYEMKSRSLCLGSVFISKLIKSLCSRGNLEAAEKCLGVMVDRSIEVGLEALYETLVSSYIERGDTKRANVIRNKVMLKGK